MFLTDHGGVMGKCFLRVSCKWFRQLSGFVHSNSNVVLSLAASRLVDHADNNLVC